MTELTYDDVSILCAIMAGINFKMADFTLMNPLYEKLKIMKIEKEADEKPRDNSFEVKEK